MPDVHVWQALRRRRGVRAWSGVAVVVRTEVGRAVCGDATCACGAAFMVAAGDGQTQPRGKHHNRSVAAHVREPTSVPTADCQARGQVACIADFGSG
jgi:hypothetical protein